MGRQRVELTVTASLSRHNDEQDDSDNAAWELFGDEARKLAERPEFADLLLDVYGGGV